MKLGVAYYPEHWPEERWPEDLRLMKEANFSIIRLADFAWSKMEPSEGNFDFSWLDKVISMIEEAGLKVILCTPTAAPPAWLIQKYPEILPMDRRKYRMEFGTRMHRCLSNIDFRRHSRLITEAMARHYQHHPAVFAWQLDNESEGNLCYCPVCAQKFHQWLAQKYKTLENLNKSWGTVFWSQDYTSWEQIPLPWESKCGIVHNPSLQLDFQRFATATTVSFLIEQKDIIRNLGPHWIITHDFRGLQNDIDCSKVAPVIDVVSYNNYPFYDGEQNAALTHDFHYGQKQQPFWITEQQVGITGWETMFRNPEPGLVRLWVWQAVAHGADLISFFRWRSCRFGTEQFWHGILDHSGQSNRRYREIAKLGDELKRIDTNIAPTRPQKKVAIIQSFEQNWAFAIQPQINDEGFQCWPQVRRIFDGLYELGMAVDIIPEENDWSRYRVLIFPSWYLVDEAFAEKIERYVHSGGTVLFHPRSGVKDLNNVCHNIPLPGPLSKVLGVEIEDYEPLSATFTNTVKFDGEEFSNNLWAEVIVLKGAKPVAVHGKRYYCGGPAVTVNHFGSGRAYYMGCLPETRFYPQLFRKILQDTDLIFKKSFPKGIEVSSRVCDSYKLYFILNFTDELNCFQLDFGAKFEVLLGKEYIQRKGNETIFEIPSREIVLLKDVF